MIEFLLVEAEGLREHPHLSPPGGCAWAAPVKRRGAGGETKTTKYKVHREPDVSPWRASRGGKEP